MIKNLINKFKAETPKFAKCIRNTAMAISGCALAIMTALVAAQSRIPDWWGTVYPYLVGIPAAIAFFSQFSTKKDDE